MSGQRFYGKYRGTVTNNVDPMQIGRIQATVPAIGPIPTSWALPCVPVAARMSGTWFLPQIGAAVWMEFEGGDPDYPIWTGCFWGVGAEVPNDAKLANPVTPSIVLQSSLMNRIVISDVPGPLGGIALKTTTGASLIVNDTGIYIDNGKGGKITLIGPNVNINNGALTVI
jgi:uncharacterized protein involved in type VI secretion and phage assembly